MAKETYDKFLIIDKSGWDPFSWAISNQWMTLENIKDFWDMKAITPVMAEETVKRGEFTSSSYNSNLFSGNHVFDFNPVLRQEDNFCLSEIDGMLTIRSLTSKDLMVKIESASESTITTDIDVVEREGMLGEFSKYQTKLWEATPQWPRLGSPDRSFVDLQRKIAAENNSMIVASLVNDKDLKAQIKIEEYQSYGAASMLAGMVLAGFLRYQKASRVFYKWKSIDGRWVPKSPFKRILDVERQRINSGKSFWV